MHEHASIILNLPYYNSTLYMCLTPSNSNEVFHQGNRYFAFLFPNLFLSAFISEEPD